jgi:hypothetical protein
MAKWDKRTLKLPEKHGWHARPGFKIFVADRGAVRFDFPNDWVVEPGDDGSIKFHDKQPPDDDCTLAMSVMRLPPGDWSGLKLSFLVEKLVEKDTRGSTLRGKIIEVHRADLDLAWAEVEFTDPNEKRLARSRTCVARASNIQPLITFDFWVDQAPQLGKIWDEILRSLRVAEPILDPTLGQPNRG